MGPGAKFQRKASYRRAASECRAASFTPVGQRQGSLAYNQTTGVRVPSGVPLGMWCKSSTAAFHVADSGASPDIPTMPPYVNGQTAGPLTLRWRFESSRWHHFEDDSRLRRPRRSGGPGTSDKHAGLVRPQGGRPTPPELDIRHLSCKKNQRSRTMNGAKRR